MPEIMIKIIVFVFGSITGSFLNVCIYRWPLEQSVVRPRSHCPHCKKAILWYDNVPLFSYLMLRGRCRFCKQGISFRYFLVEFITAGIFLFFYIQYGLSLNFAFYTIFVCALIVATFVDIAHRIIPDEVSLGGIVVGFLFGVTRSFLQPGGFRFERSITGLMFNPPPVLDSFLGILLGGGIIYFTGKVFDLVYFKLLKNGPVDGEMESMGAGDVKLLAMIGAFLGWKIAVLTFFIAPLFGSVIGGFNLIFKKRHTIPYGPFLSMAAFLNLFWAEAIFRLLFLI